MEDSFSTDWGEVDSFKMILVHYIYCVLFSVITHQLHLSSLGMRSQTLGAPALSGFRLMFNYRINLKMHTCKYISIMCTNMDFFICRIMGF